MGTLQGKRGNLVNEYQQSDMHRSNSGTKSAGYRRIASRCISTGVILSCLLAFHAIAEASTAPAKGKRPVSANAASSAHPVIVSEFSDVDFVPDGDLGKKVWATARRVRFDQGGFTRIEYPKAETVVASR